MKITYYGHSCFGIELKGKHLLFDPFISPNPLLPGTGVSAETVKADFLITRDKDLLSLPKNKWKVTEIITPEVLLHLLRTKKLIK